MAEHEAQLRALRDDEADPIRQKAAAALEKIGLWQPPAQSIAFNIVADGNYSIAPHDGETYIVVVAPGVNALLQERATGCVRILVLLEQGAKLRYFSSNTQQSAPTRIAHLATDAELDWIDAALASTTSDNTAFLQGNGASAKFRSLFIGTTQEKYSVNTRMIHEGSHTTSNMLTRAALLEKSSGTYRGIIQILPGARGCEAFQREDTLLLGDESAMDAQPILEIGNDDVKCSHGVTIGQVDAEKLFYLESRGIDTQSATALITGGFFDQMLISMGEHGAYLRACVAERLQQESSYAEDFPILKRRMSGKPLVYLDSAASTQKPELVIEGIKHFYEQSYANVHRGIYPLAEEATNKYEAARKKVSSFINASPQETIFTRSTTDGINMIARSIAATLKPGDEIVVSAMEHHSNFVPWQQLCKQYGLIFKVITLTPDDVLDIDDARSKITSKTKVVAVTHVSNVLGVINPVRELAALAHANGAMIVVDGAQAVAHMPVDVKALDVDFYAFSGHKMYGPEGIGVLYGKREHLERLEPSSWGGEMVEDVTIERSTWNELPYKFEPGTPDMAQAVGLGIAIDYIAAIGWESIQVHEQELLSYALQQLKQIDGLHVIGPQTADARCGVIAFMVHGVHSHDVAQVLGDEGIAIRAGNHCARPLHCEKGILATARISFGIYNSKRDIDRFISAIKKTQVTLT